MAITNNLGARVERLMTIPAVGPIRILLARQSLHTSQSAEIRSLRNAEPQEGELLERDTLPGLFKVIGAPLLKYPFRVLRGPADNTSRVAALQIVCLIRFGV
jgi:hypothetical protein